MTRDRGEVTAAVVVGGAVLTGATTAIGAVATAVSENELYLVTAILASIVMIATGLAGAVIAITRAWRKKATQLDGIEAALYGDPRDPNAPGVLRLLKDHLQAHEDGHAA